MYILEFLEDDEYLESLPKFEILRKGNSNILSERMRELQEENTRLSLQIIEEHKLIASIHNVNPLLVDEITLDRVLQGILENVVKGLKYDRAVIYLWDEEKRFLKCKETKGFTPEGEKLAKEKPFDAHRHDCIEIRAAKSITYTFIKDHRTDPRLTELDKKIAKKQGRISTLYVPLKSKGETFGIIGVDRDHTQFEITKHDIQKLMLFANHASIAIENARLYEQNQSKIRYLIKLHEISKRLSKIKNIDRLAEEVLNEAVEISGAKSGAIWCRNFNRQTLELRYSRGYDGDYSKKIRIDLNEQPFLEACQKPTIVLISDLHKYGNMLPFHNSRGSAFLLPITCYGETAGVLQIDSQDGNMFNETLTEVMKIYASQVGKMFENLKLHNRLIEEKRFLENVLNSLEIAVIITGMDGRLISINPKAEEIFKLKKERVEGKLISDIFFGSKERIAQIIHTTIKKKQNLLEEEIEYLDDEANLLALRISTYTFYNDENRISGVTTMVQDFTEKKKMRDSLTRMEKMAALGNLAAGVAHEIRNPLSGIYTTVQNLISDLSLEGERKQDLEAILEEVDRMETLIKQILSFARPSQLETSEVEVNSLLHKSISSLKDKIIAKEIRVIEDLDASLPSVRLDPAKIKQVFLNILINAVEASKPRGRIEIRTAQNAVQRNGKRKLLSITFKDYGIGIPQENIPRIFDPFFSTKNNGTGLGLSICQKIVEEHGGEIQVESIPQQGSTFTIQFPL
nr:GAF domain-containing protein [Desulfobacterales bacterium]